MRNVSLFLTEYGYLTFFSFLFLFLIREADFHISMAKRHDETFHATLFRTAFASKVEINNERLGQRDDSWSMDMSSNSREFPTFSWLERGGERGHEDPWVGHVIVDMALGDGAPEVRSMESLGLGSQCLLRTDTEQ